jgi:transcriptional regulator with XRE-family HTH domain
VDPQKEIREFLTSRRARISPERLGLGAQGGKRRVPGLRREEVALLAGISVDYYTRLERGNAAGVSPSVLEALARALELDEAERVHLRHLVQAGKTVTGPNEDVPAEPLRPSVQHLLDAITAAPALLRNGRMDILAANRLGVALHAPVLSARRPPRPVNHARYFFLDPRARELYVDWRLIAEGPVSLLRAEAGRHPTDRVLLDLIDDLTEGSDDFRSWWERHDVRFPAVSSVVRFHHPVVGDLALTYETMTLAPESGLAISAYVAEPGSPSEAALQRLGELTTLGRSARTLPSASAER